jgi:tRNA(Arg) A34 adenosine deaminase TadA
MFLLLVTTVSLVALPIASIVLVLVLAFHRGKGLDLCEAIHAEQNALLQCRDTKEIEVAYVTASPCVTCVKLFMNTGCKRIVFLEEYPHSAAKELWKGEWTHHGTIEHVYAELKLAPTGRVARLHERQGDLFGLRNQGSTPT